MLNLIDDGVEPHLWEMVAFVVAQIGDAQAVSWSRSGDMHFLRQYPDGTQALIEWKFGKDEFKNYVQRLDHEARATFIADAGTNLNKASESVEKLDQLPEGMKLMGYLPKREL